MAAYVFSNATLTLTFDGGMNEMNKQVVKRLTLRNVKEEATATSLQLVAQAISTLAANPMIDAVKASQHEIV